MEPSLSLPYKVKDIPPEKQEAIFNDLFQFYQAKFGDTWTQNLTKNLRPSPVKELAQKHGVSVATIRLAKHILWLIGTTLAEASSPTQ
jgi:hypothetical protein